MSEAANSNPTPDPLAGMSFSGITSEGSPWEKDWLAFTDGEYYNRVRAIMCKTMGEGDVEMILGNIWTDGWIAGNRANR